MSRRKLISHICGCGQVVEGLILFAGFFEQDRDMKMLTPSLSVPFARALENLGSRDCLVARRFLSALNGRSHNIRVVSVFREER